MQQCTLLEMEFKIFVIPLFCIDKDTSSSKKKKINAILIFEVE